MNVTAKTKERKGPVSSWTSWGKRHSDKSKVREFDPQTKAFLTVDNPVKDFG